MCRRRDGPFGRSDSVANHKLPPARRRFPLVAAAPSTDGGWSGGSHVAVLAANAGEAAEPVGTWGKEGLQAVAEALAGSTVGGEPTLVTS
jgi:hypothetical protein